MACRGGCGWDIFRPLSWAASDVAVRARPSGFRGRFNTWARSAWVAQEEQVLVVERKVLEQVGMFQGLAFDVERYRRALFVPGVPRFMPRPQAEADPTFKQLIPYVIMTHDGKYLSYVRGKRAGETRLVGHRSIGIGGHINPADDMPLFGTDFWETYLAAVEREVAEEVAVEAGYTDRVVAFLNDDSREVGQVHLGIVHLWVLDSAKVSRREQMITQMGFLTAGELQGVRDTMETWSTLCLDGLEKMAARG
jgi:predicted NUDIX family phosphoesterase